MKTPTKGTRVRFIGTVERGMEFSLDLTGEEGEVAFSTQGSDIYFWVKLDKHHEELDPWDNCIQVHWADDDDINAFKLEGIFI